MLKSPPRNIQWVFLVFLSLAGLGLIWLDTSKYGAGVAGDSIQYLSVADNLLKGRGFINFTGDPLILFPPLFPIIIAGLAWIFHVDVFIAGWIFNLLLWGLNIFLSGLVLMHVFRVSPRYFYLSMLIIFFSSSALAMHASILSDPLFLTFTLLFFLAGENYIQKPAWQPWLAILVLALLAALLRFSGFAQIVAGCLIILIAHRRNILKSLPLAALFGIISLLPIALWIYFHNFLPYHTWWGTNNSVGANVLVNLLQSLRKIGYWFIPYRTIFGNEFIESVVVIVVILVFLLAINKLQNWQAWAKEWLRPAQLSILVLTTVYFSSSILNIQTLDHKVLFSDRYFVIIMVPILALIFISFIHLVLPHFPARLPILKITLLIIFSIWLLYPLSKDYKYLQASLATGEDGYNQYNNRAFQESPLLSRVKDLLEKEPDARIYSNVPPVVWFYTRHIISPPPVQDTTHTRDEIKSLLAGWPKDKPGYYVSFEPDDFGLFMPLQDLYLVANIEPLEKTSDGTLARISSRASQ